MFHLIIIIIINYINFFISGLGGKPLYSPAGRVLPVYKDSAGQQNSTSFINGLKRYLCEEQRVTVPARYFQANLFGSLLQDCLTLVEG